MLDICLVVSPSALAPQQHCLCTKLCFAAKHVRYQGSGATAAFIAAVRRGAGATMDGPDGGRRQRDENSLRVTNLSEDVTEADLQALFRPFGPISRVFLAVDKTTGENRGFAFVNYHHR